MRCDLHVHTRHSGMCTIPLLRRVCRESYNEPEAVYEKLKRLGMDLVTVTDHDSIDAVEALRRHPDFFLSEEVTCRMPSGTEVHVGVYGIDERRHIEIQRRRNDVPALAAYLDEQGLLFSINHVFSCLTGRRELRDFDLFAELFPAMETRNGAMPKRANRYSAHLARWMRKAPLGGSDAHAMRLVGRVYTEAPGARTTQEFLDGLRRGAGVVHGSNGSLYGLTADVLRIGYEMVRERPATALLGSLAVAAPVVTLVHYALEHYFADAWLRRLALSRAMPSTVPAWSPVATDSEAAA